MSVSGLGFQGPGMGEIFTGAGGGGGSIEPLPASELLHEERVPSSDSASLLIEEALAAIDNTIPPEAAFIGSNASSTPGLVLSSDDSEEDLESELGTPPPPLGGSAIPSGDFTLDEMATLDNLLHLLHLLSDDSDDPIQSPVNHGTEGGVSGITGLTSFSTLSS